MFERAKATQFNDRKEVHIIAIWTSLRSLNCESFRAAETGRYFL